MSRFVHNGQIYLKKTSGDFGLYSLRVATGGWIGLIFAHLFQRMFGFQNLLFFFVIVLMTGALVRVSKNWGLVSVFIFNLICILVGALLRMYLEVAPGM